MSPYSWFAAERIGALMPEARWRGVFAGAVFKANGRMTWGLSSERPERIADCEQRAAAHGLGPIRWPEPWPTSDLVIARAMAFADMRGRLEQYALAAMRLCFLDGTDLGEPEAACEAAARSGLDPDELRLALSSEEVKQRLRETTDEAIAAGVFGVPTVLVGEGLYWGDDRLDEAAMRATGLDGT
jgi:2-hydroxychromene-2-carboxylate isomerase